MEEQQRSMEEEQSMEEENSTEEEQSTEVEQSMNESHTGENKKAEGETRMGIELENEQIIEINEYTDRMDTVRRAGDLVSLNLMENRISIFDAQTEQSLMI